MARQAPFISLPQAWLIGSSKVGSVPSKSLCISVAFSNKVVVASRRSKSLGKGMQQVAIRRAASSKWIFVGVVAVWIVV